MAEQLTDQELAIKSGQDTAKINIKAEKLENEALTAKAETATTETPSKPVGNKK